MIWVYRLSASACFYQEGYLRQIIDAEGWHIATVQQNAAKLQGLMKSQGWLGGTNGVTLTSLIDGTAKGIDWSPDAFMKS